MRQKTTSFVGTRGWSFGEEEDEDRKVFDRELLRLELSIKTGLEAFRKNQAYNCLYALPTNE